MGVARPVIAGKTYMVTRRCAGRRFLLKPSRVVNLVVSYMVAVASERFGVEIHAVCLMSNHYHILLTDKLGTLPFFMHLLNSSVARALNAFYGRWESFFAPGTYSRVELLATEDVLDKLLYVLGNPVAAGLVRRGREWPGTWLGPVRSVAAWCNRDSDGVEVERPEHFFRAEGAFPKLARLSITKPPACVDLSDEEYQALIENLLEAQEDEIATEMDRQQKEIIGVPGVLDVPTDGTPASREPRRELNPQIAARDKALRIAALDALKRFLEAYRAAMVQFRDGLRDVIFPAGTWMPRLRFGVRCADP